MPGPEARAQSIAAALTAAGFTPRVRRRPGHVRVEIDAPAAPSRETWRAVLAALDRGDRFGLDSDADGSTAWALVSTRPPATRELNP
ncbi:hypothetical protein ACWGJ2_15025 [Streptomyces sp. NPDC054796]